MGSTESLWFGRLGWGDAELTLLAKALPTCHKLEWLDLSENEHVSLNGIRKLLPALLQLPQLHQLDLHGCLAIGEQGRAMLNQHLPVGVKVIL